MTDKITGIKNLTTGMPALKLRVGFDVAIPNNLASEADVTEWLKHNLGVGSLRFINPLADFELRVTDMDWSVAKIGVFKA